MQNGYAVVKPVAVWYADAKLRTARFLESGDNGRPFQNQ